MDGERRRTSSPNRPGADRSLRGDSRFQWIRRPGALDPQRHDLDGAVVLNRTSTPSLLFLLMTLGPRCCSQAVDRGTPSGFTQRRLRRVPMLYFVLHFTFIHLLAVIVCYARYERRTGCSSRRIWRTTLSVRRPLGLLSAHRLRVWIFVVIAMYPICRWFAALRQRRSMRAQLPLRRVTPVHRVRGARHRRTGAART